MNEEQFPEDVDTVDSIEEASAENTAPKKKIGKPFTKENARQMAISAAKARSIRRKARNEMLNTLVTELNFGEEAVKAFRSNDPTRLAMIEKAITMIGLHFNQSSDAVQKLDISADTKSKVDSTLEIRITDASEPKG